MRRTPLEGWIRERIACGAPPAGFGRQEISRYQEGKLREVVDRVVSHSPFYRERLAGFSADDLRTLADLERFPFTTAADLREQGPRMLCVSQDEIARVVTLQSSGTTAASKRIFFTESDLELTLDFFHHGMSTLVEAGQRVLVLMPGERPGSVGDLLVKALERMRVEGLVHGPVADPAGTISEIRRLGIDCLVGLPTQVLALARHPQAREAGMDRIRSVLLCSDYVPTAIVRELRRVWSCRVFSHYGMTEMGLGGGVDCDAGKGYHLREADLYFEIVDPATGLARPEGEHGEIVFTTLTRTGMPLVRYRTGDMSRFLPKPCPCGTVLKGLHCVRGRLEGGVTIGRQDLTIDMAALDEALFPVDGLLDFEAVVTRDGVRNVLTLTLRVAEDRTHTAAGEILPRLTAIPAIRRAILEDSLILSRPRLARDPLLCAAMAKRRILDERQGNGADA
ncbi:MAG: DVU_1553 family AMP-dependent CoA ligase [bacterium]